MSTPDAQFVAAARTYIGVPWKHQGRSRRGVDCIGLVVMAARDCGMDVTIEANYGFNQQYRKMKALLLQHCERQSGPGEGVIILYKSAEILHLAVMTAEGTIIHAYGPKRAVIEGRLNFEPMQFWRPKWP